MKKCFSKPTEKTIKKSGISLSKHGICAYKFHLLGASPKTPIEIKIKGDVIIRIIEWIKKIKEYYETIKADVLKILSGTKAECTLSFDLEDLERIVRCVLSVFFISTIFTSGNSTLYPIKNNLQNDIDMLQS